MDHYRLLKGWDKENDFIKNFKIQTIPKLLIVNQDGKVFYNDHPLSKPFDEMIYEQIFNKIQSNKKEIG